MSFAFSWPRAFPSAFYETARNNLEQAMNAGSKLPLAADRILVQELHLGTIPPELDLLEINQLSIDGSFSGSFFLSYNGNAYISLVTHLHVNPLSSILLSAAKMMVQLTLSQLRLRCVISVSFSKASGLTLVFKDDPLESLNVSSSFDDIGVISVFLQREIENQLRERFRRDLPTLIHKLSQRWVADINNQPTGGPSAPITVERERGHHSSGSGTDTDTDTDDAGREPDSDWEPDDSLLDPPPHSQYYGEGEEERSMRAPSPAVSSDSDLTLSDEEEDGGDEGKAASFSFSGIGASTSQARLGATPPRKEGPIHAAVLASSPGGDARRRMPPAGSPKQSPLLRPRQPSGTSVTSPRLRPTPVLHSPTASGSALGSSTSYASPPPPVNAGSSNSEEPRQPYAKTRSPSVSASSAPRRHVTERIRSASASATTSSALAEAEPASDSPILRSLQSHHQHFATTFSNPIERKTSTNATGAGANEDQADALPDLASLLGTSPGAGTGAGADAGGSLRTRRRRIHRLDTPSPNTSPQKSGGKDKGKGKGTGRVASGAGDENARPRVASFRQADFDEYFPVSGRERHVEQTHLRTSASASAVSRAVPVHKQKQQDAFGSDRAAAAAGWGEGSRQRSGSTMKPGLRRNMMSSRLRDPNFFAPNYPG